MNITTIDKSHGLLARTITVEEDEFASGTYLRVREGNGKEICTALREATPKLIEALAGDTATVITDLPEVKEDGYGFLDAGVYTRSKGTSPEEVLENAKALLAIHKVLVEQQAKAEEAKAAEAAKEAERTARRDELAAEFRGWGSYGGSSETFQKAIDRIIELEEAAK